MQCICQLEQHLPGKLTSLRGAFSQVPVPQHRMTPLKNAWLQLYEPITKNLKLDMRMNLKTKKVCSYFAFAKKRLLMLVCIVLSDDPHPAGSRKQFGRC